MNGKLITVSAKVSKKVKDELEKLGVNISDAIRSGLERELKERKLRELQLVLERVDLSKVSEEEIVQVISETREEN